MEYFKEINSTFLHDENGLLKVLTVWPWALLGAAFAIGFLAMSILDGIKPLLHEYNFRIWVKQWFYEGKIKDELIDEIWENGSDYNVRFKQEISRGNYDWRFENNNALKQLFLLTTGGNREALYRLPVENLCGQIVVAAQSALEFPGAYPGLILQLVKITSNNKTIIADMKTFYDFKDTINQIDNTENSRYIEAKNRIGTAIQRNIDNLQINMSHNWKKKMRTYSLIMSFFLSVLAGSLFKSEVNTSTWLIVIILLTYEGAYLAALIKGVFDLLNKRLT